MREREKERWSKRKREREREVDGETVVEEVLKSKPRRATEVSAHLHF